MVVKSAGAIYFTDPSGPLAPDQFDVAASGVYRVSTDLGSISLIVDDMVGPNGIAFSPDESILYVTDSRRRHVRASRSSAERHAGETDQPDLRRPRWRRVRRAGRHEGGYGGHIYTGGAGGLYVIDSKGKKLGRIVHGLPATTNVAFGGDDWKTLFFTTRTSLNMVNVKISGIAVPAKKKA